LNLRAISRRALAKLANVDVFMLAEQHHCFEYGAVGGTRKNRGTMTDTDERIDSWTKATKFRVETGCKSSDSNLWPVFWIRAIGVVASEC
jgi:hypothetical protein